MKLVKQDLSHTCLVLTPDQIHEMSQRFKSVPRDYCRKRTDFVLLDATRQILESANRYDLIAQLRLSVKKDNGITKQFYHYAQTFENLDHFLAEEVERTPFRWNINYKVAIAMLRKMLRIESCHLSPVEIKDESDQFKVWSNPNASAGAIGSGSKSDNVHETFLAFQRIKSAIKEGKSYSAIQIPNYPFHRAQISGYVKDGKLSPATVKQKDRLVFGMDAATVTLEGQYAKPFIQYCVSNFYGYVGGDEPVQIRSKIRIARSRKNFWYGIDFSKFDQTVQSWVIKDIFDIIKEGFGSETYSELDFIRYNFINTLLIKPGGEIVQKHRGIPSGSNFTQIVGSMANALMMLTYLASRQGGNFEDKMGYVTREIKVGPGCYGMFVMGDDNLMFTDHEINIQSLSKYVHRIFGVMIHPDKTETSKDMKFPSFLKREWRVEGEYRDFLDLMVNVIHPERDRKYDNYSPWHILYGLYLTYHCTWRGLVSEDFLLEKMEDNGGIDRLIELDYNELPGSLKSFGYKQVPFLYEHAKAILRSKAA